jgi:hypothetical protein
MNSDGFRRISIGILFFLISGFSFGQQQVIISLRGITDAEFDRFGNLYLSTEQGTIVKYDSSCNKVHSWSSAKVLPVTSIDAGHNFRIFGFYKNGQFCLLLDRNFRLLNEMDIGRWAGNGTATAYGSDHSIWLFDESELSLKKVDPILNQILLSVRLPLITRTDNLSIIQIEEYQNRIYVNNMEEGLYVFDILGNLLLQPGITTRYFFKFYRDELFFIDKGMLKSLHIYSQEVENLYKIKETENIVTVLADESRILLVYHDRVVRIR